MSSPTRLLETPGKNIRALASDGRRVVACEAQGCTHVIGRRNGELYRLHAGEPTVDALIDADVLLLVGGSTGTLHAVGLVDGEPRPCPSLSGVDFVRAWSAPEGTLDRVEGLIVHVAMDDGSRVRFDLETRRLV